MTWPQVTGRLCFVMRARFLAAPFALLLALAFAVPAAAAPHDLVQQPKNPHGNWVQPPKTLPHVRRDVDPAKNLNFLFGALKAAPDEETAKAIEHRIWALWMISGSDTANLLMTRVRSAVEGKDLDLAVKLLDAIVKIRPGYVEAWNRRATIYYMKRDYGRALADIRQVLKREPRHFGALSGLGLILQDIGDDKQALEVYRRTLKIYPRIERIPDLVKELQIKVEGRDI
jgi:tetratricopeptide (TPR) repeat protein